MSWQESVMEPRSTDAELKLAGAGIFTMFTGLALLVGAVVLAAAGQVTACMVVGFTATGLMVSGILVEGWAARRMRRRLRREP